MLISKYGNGNIEEIKKFEEKYNIIFESDYFNFLLKYNGGQTPNTFYKNGKISEVLRYLYGINTKEDIEKQLEFFDFKKKQCIPIGEDVFGNYYAIGISEKNKGQIFFCNHEKGFDTKKITNTFKEFLSKCISNPIDDGARKSPEEIEKEMIQKDRGSFITDALRQAWKEQYEKYKDLLQEEIIL